MSIIRIQASGQSLVNYFATAIAAVSTLWVYPLALDMYGLAQVMIGMALLIIPIATAGTVSVVVKFFAAMKNLGQRKSYLFNLLILCFGATAITIAILAWIGRPVLNYLEVAGFDRRLIVDQKNAILALVAVVLYARLLMLHASNYHKIIIPSIYQNVVPKLILPVLLLGVYYGWIEEHEFIRYWVISFIVPAIGLTVHLFRIGALDIRPVNVFFRKQHFPRIMNYSFFLGVSTVAHTIITRIDVVMIGALIGVKEAGLYSIALYISNILQIPYESINNISSPMISTAFEKDDRVRIADIYKKSSLNLLLLGVLMYFLILGSLDAVLQFSPKYESIQDVVALFLLLGAAKLIDMGASVNQQIIVFSPKYKFMAPMMILIAITNILLNYYLIRSYGLQGAAIATLVSIILFNSIKMAFIQYHYKMHPFSQMTLKILVLLIVSIGYFMIIPGLKFPVFQILVFCTGLTIIYLLLIVVLRIKSDLTDTAMGTIYKMINTLTGKGPGIKS